MVEEGGSELSNICFLKYSFTKPLEKIGKETYKISNKEEISLFKNIMSFRQPIEYKPRTQPWLWCISNYQEEDINGNHHLFGILNRIRPKEIEKIFDWNKFEEKETIVENVIESQVKFVIIPNLKLIVTEYKELISDETFKKIFKEIWGKINDNGTLIRFTEMEEKWTYAKVIREFDKINQLHYKNVPYPNPIIDEVIRDAKQFFIRTGADKLDDLKLTGDLTAEEHFLVSLARVVELKKRGEYEGYGEKNGKVRYFHSGKYKLRDKIEHKKDDAKDFIKNVLESIDRLFFRKF